MSGADARETVRLRRQRLIERLNAKEAELAGLRGTRPQLFEDHLGVEIEMERWRNLSHRGSAQMWGG